MILRSHQPADFNGKMREASRASPKLRAEAGDAAGKDSLATGSPGSVKPEVALSIAEAQAIVDRVADGRMVAQLRVVHGGEIGAVYEISMIGGPPSLVCKIPAHVLASRFA
jgi:hypothetical protein